MKQICVIIFLLLCQRMWAQNDYDDVMATMVLMDGDVSRLDAAILFAGFYAVICRACL